ncbi:UbiA family prenyltransferase [Streptosporangium sp. NPDC000396]|uniref:UbiA family prenyltransferase n=1 Tax=Streptosporangium sp. NPDC000396 TaxID=3366185 RepID=UPI00369099B2
MQIVFAMRFLVGAILGGKLDVASAMLGVTIWYLTTTAVYVFNGVTDVVEDRVNGSKRPIASGDVSLRAAATVSISYAILALIGGAIEGNGLFWFVLLFLALEYLYSGPPFRWKRSTPGAIFVVIGMGGLSYAAGSWGAGGVELGAFATAAVLWMGLVGATSKDLHDEEGDRAAGRRTWVVAWGQTRARAAIGVSAVGVGLGFLFFALGLVHSLIPAAVVFCVGGLTVAGLVVSPSTLGGRSKARRPYLIFMITQYLANITIIVQFAMS